MPDGFRIDAPLGMGPDGVVHRAVAERMGARPVALRRLPIPTGPARRRLRDDAESIASLGHPAIAVVEDIVEVDDEHVLVASTLGTQGTLADRLVLGPLPVDEAAALLRTLADALDAAHRVGLVHGHVRASNVLHTTHGPVVCDLVQSRALGRRAAGDGAARDTADLVRMAATLVDSADRSPRAAAYRALCRWSSEADAGLDQFVAALDRLDQVAAPATARGSGIIAPPPSPPSITQTSHGSGSVGLVVALSLAIGAAVGALGTLLPIVG